MTEFEFVRFHVCDPDDLACRCPVHDTPMIYSAHRQTHACQDVDCVHGHGEVVEGDRVVFTGYAPALAEMPGVLTTILTRVRDGKRTGYVIALDGGSTVCAEPHQLRRETETP